MEGGDLARLWKGGKHGYLSPLMQAKAWGLSEAGVPHDDIAGKIELKGRLFLIQECTGDAHTASAGAGRPAQISVAT